MADESKPETPKESKWGQRLKNWFVTGFNSIGGNRSVKKATRRELQYKLYSGQPLLDAQPVLRLKEKELLEINRERALSVVGAEANWDAFDEGSKGFRHDVMKAYQNAMIYVDPVTSGFEYRLHQVGVPGGWDPEKKCAIQDIMINGIPYHYPLPREVRVRYPISGLKKEWIVEISPFGYQNIARYSNMYEQFIKKVCEDTERMMHATAKSDEEREAIKKNINQIQGIYFSVVSDYIKKYCMEFENNYYSFVKGVVAGAKDFNAIKTSFQPKSLMQPSERGKFLYYNTYNIIQPVVYGKGENSGKIIAMLVDEKDIKDVKGIKTIPWKVRKDEVGPGLDKFGFPLEVDDDGSVIIDKHDFPNNRLEWRKVPNEGFTLNTGLEDVSGADAEELKDVIRAN